MSIYLILEVGVNHRGDLSLAKLMARTAKELGGDCCKFQTYKTERICSPKSAQYDVLKECELTYDKFRELNDYCRKIGIEFMSTPDTAEDAIFLETLGMRYMKIGSANANQDFYDELFAHGVKTPLLVSLGMGSEPIIGQRIKHLHCVSSYPVPDDQANMKACRRKCIKGFSDHTTGSIAAIMAVALGSTIIEKHFTMNKAWEGPDHHMSMEPDELRQYVKDIRRAEKMLGDGVRRMMPCEEATRKLLAERR